MSEQQQVLKICTPLSNVPFYIKIEHDMSMDNAITEAVLALSNTGKPLESQQLEQLYKKHQMFNDGGVVNKGSLFSELVKEKNVVGDIEVQVASVDLVSAHSGGINEFS